MCSIRTSARNFSSSGRSVSSMMSTRSSASFTMYARSVGCRRGLMVCRTLPASGIPKYASRCSYWFQQRVATRSPRRRPSRWSATASFLARGTKSAYVYRWRVLSGLRVMIALCPKRVSARRRMNASVSGYSIIRPSTSMPPLSFGDQPPRSTSALSTRWRAPALSTHSGPRAWTTSASTHPASGTRCESHCKIFRSSQRKPRSQDALDRRIVGKIDEHRHMIESSLLLKVLPEEASLISSNSHCCEDCGEGFLGSLDPSLTGDLRRDHIMRQPSAREKRQFLPPNKSIHAVNRRDSSLNELAWVFPSERIDR